MLLRNLVLHLTIMHRNLVYFSQFLLLAISIYYSKLIAHLFRTNCQLIFSCRCWNPQVLIHKSPYQSHPFSIIVLAKCFQISSCTRNILILIFLTEFASVLIEFVDLSFSFFLFFSWEKPVGAFNRSDLITCLSIEAGRPTDGKKRTDAQVGRERPNQEDKQQARKCSACCYTSKETWRGTYEEEPG